MFTPFASLTGGVLIGLSAAILLLLHGRIAGISGIAGGVFRPRDGELGWKLTFLAGLIGGGFLIALFRPQAFPAGLGAPAWLLVGAGLLVGFGARLGGGCTSGHGVCGLGRLSRRSLVATLTFMATAAATVLVLRHLAGGAP